MKPDFKQFDDIPGTTIFTIQRAQEGFSLNQFCMSLRKEENRKKFLANEAEYLKDWNLSKEQIQAVLDRNFQQMLDLGGNVYFLSKIFATDGLSYVQAVSTMTDMNVEEYKAIMLAGGRNVEGLRSKKEQGKK